MRLVRWMTLTGFSLILVAPVPPGASAEVSATPEAQTAPSAQETQAAPPAHEMWPRIEVDQPEQSAGDVKPGQRVKYSFAIRNTGRMPLQIEKVKPDCGCVVAEYDATIPPGGVGQVRASLNTTGRRGDVRKHLRVTCNDPEQPAIMLTMTARVFQPIEVFPSADLLVPLTPGRVALAEVVIRCNEPTPLEIEKVESSHPHLTVRVIPAPKPLNPAATTPQSQQPDHRLELVIPKSAPMAGFDATVTLHVNLPERPTIVIRVTAYPHNAVVANPPRLYFGEVMPDAAGKLARTITLFRRLGAFRVLEATTADPALELKIDPSPDGTYCDVRASYRGGWQPGMVTGKITLRTDDPGRPTIEVPYEAVVVQ